MGDRYQQFLGTRPGLVVELVDDSASPYRVKTEQGFEFYISADDFGNYYKKEGTRSPARWRRLVTLQPNEFVESEKMARAMDVVGSMRSVFNDFYKARDFVKDALQLMKDSSGARQPEIVDSLKAKGWDTEQIPQDQWDALASLDVETREILEDNSCATVPLFEVPASLRGDNGLEEPGAVCGAARDGSPGAKPKKTPAKPRLPRMKNIDLGVDGDKLTITVDLSQDFGLSKSEKSVIVASSVGNKTIPGRSERIGLNVYKVKPEEQTKNSKEAKKAPKGRKTEFKNMSMSVDGDTLTIHVDLSKECGLSKSGQTMLIASTGGNQLVFGREERIGLNIYRPID